MSELRFLHAADLHIGSPLQKLELYPGAPIETMRRAPTQAVENLIDVAISHHVDAVLIAGDLFDGPWEDMRVGLWLVEQFRRLEREQIPVVLIRGNHDAHSVVIQQLAWPKNVVEFGSNAPDTLVLDCGLAVHGQSFRHAAMMEDLAARYPQAKSGAFNVGLLHTSLTGNALHDPYAPTELRTLEDKGYGYWALGHIHQRSESSLSSVSWIGYSGNTQGRSIRETGPKGCYLVHVHDQRVDRVEFIATDVARWHILTLDTAECETLEDLKQSAKDRIEDSLLRQEGRTLALRIRMTGSTKLHSLLQTPSGYASAVATLRNLANELEQAWVEKVEIHTQPPMSSHALQATQWTLDEMEKVMATWKENAWHDSALQHPKQLLQQKIASQLQEMGWTTERSPEWQPDWENLVRQAYRYLEGSLLGQELQDLGTGAVSR